MKDQWYHTAILYSLDLETYMDGDGDGIGDFVGLTSKLDHLSGLGINCIWLRPFFPSPLVDDGYDVKDYFTIDPRFGNPGDFVDFIIKSRALGIRVIIDLVINHTSNQHEWFLKSRSDKNSRYRDYYIWKEEITEEDQEENKLGDGGIWNWDDKAGAYYMHHFLKEQPDLNISNPDVRKEIKKIMGFWLQLGVSGFRIDAAHIIVHESKDELFVFLDDMREFVDRRNHEAVLLAEANVESEVLHKFFGKQSQGRMHLLFNFYTNKNMFLALTREDAAPLRESLVKTQKINGQWVNFLRSHDELNLEMLSDDERDEVFAAYAPDEDMRIFGHGIRRRLPPMLEGNRKKMELIYTLMFSLPGLPLINYGEEIAMGDDLSQEGRESVRTVMQWNDQENAGFSSTPESEFAHALIDSGKYDYKKLNVSMQQKDPGSFLNWMERLISTRKHCPQLSFGECSLLDNDCGSVLSFCNQWESEAIVILINLKSETCKVKVDTGKFNFGSLSELFSNEDYEPVKNIKKEIDLTAFGYRWFKSDIKK